jgi:hypothetical protein
MFSDDRIDSKSSKRNMNRFIHGNGANGGNGETDMILQAISSSFYLRRANRPRYPERKGWRARPAMPTAWRPTNAGRRV